MVYEARRQRAPDNQRYQLCLDMYEEDNNKPTDTNRSPEDGIVIHENCWIYPDKQFVSVVFNVFQIRHNYCVPCVLLLKSVSADLYSIIKIITF